MNISTEYENLRRSPSAYKDHQLTGNKNHRDCQIEPIWLLIYQLTDNAVILERTGPHSELFKKMI
ncbi:type II toxin-antitoxin system YafQ family toxin [Desulfobacula sp.]|uniref:type II toxin-antitoxin system YafQ family toxin n=1 Tax=Desulfobacula sp. TaxID=2593537 RepID=UPI0039B9972C